MASGRGEIRVHEAIHQLGRVARRAEGRRPQEHRRRRSADPVRGAEPAARACIGQPTTVVMDDFESGALTDWQAVGGGSGGWFVYSDGQRPPDPAQSDPNVPFDLPDPPQGRFAAVTDMNGPGTRILYRDLRLDGRFTAPR